MTGDYEDIIDLPHHVSGVRAQMPRINRAAQFMPFAALAGYEAALHETARLTDRKIELHDDLLSILDDKLRFLQGDIASYEGCSKVDMVVTLHACDTATDYAMEKAIGWGARVILSVPCCQHELNRTLHNELLAPVLKYGLIKERMAALITDALRAEILELAGYRVQILEFIDMEHTPKNILIRAVKKQRMRYRAGVHQGVNAIDQVCDFLNVNPTLRNLLDTNIQSEADLNEESNH